MIRYRALRTENVWPSQEVRESPARPLFTRLSYFLYTSRTWGTGVTVPVVLKLGPR
jgi:hypothetical protein